jgi:hypothetical protein
MDLARLHRCWWMGERVADMKICTQCKELKPISEYYTSLGIRHSECKVCWKRRTAEYRERQKAINAVSVITDGTKTCNQCGEIKEITNFVKSARDKGGYTNTCILCHRAETLNSKRKYREKWIVRTKEYHKAHYKEYLFRKAKSQRKRNAQRRPLDLLHKAVSSKIVRQLKGEKCGMGAFKLVGYSPEDLRKHLEKLFKPGMSWGNYGSVWHIDHIVPKAAFNIVSPRDIDFRKCWSLDNLQPLWARENSIKQDKLERPFQPSLAMAVEG